MQNVTTPASGQQHSERIVVELCRHHALLALGAHAQALDVDTQVKLLTGRNERALVVNKDIRWMEERAVARAVKEGYWQCRLASPNPAEAVLK